MRCRHASSSSSANRGYDRGRARGYKSEHGPSPRALRAGEWDVEAEEEEEGIERVEKGTQEEEVEEEGIERVEKGKEEEEALSVDGVLSSERRVTRTTVVPGCDVGLSSVSRLFGAALPSSCVVAGPVLRAHAPALPSFCLLSLRACRPCGSPCAECRPAFACARL